MAFFVAYHQGRSAGCGGIKLYGANYGEVKHMFVRLFVAWASPD